MAMMKKPGIVSKVQKSIGSKTVKKGKEAPIVRGKRAK